MACKISLGLGTRRSKSAEGRKDEAVLDNNDHQNDITMMTAVAASAEGERGSCATDPALRHFPK